ncbi:MAG: hypothetical protein AAGD14_16330 [Planctomycetota bacterium]
MRVEKELARLRRRVQGALFLRGVGEASLVLTLGLAVVLLALRFLGRPVEPALWWSWGLAIPPLFGLVRALRLDFGDGAGALHLDRRWDLGGLLITGMEADTAAWQPELQRRLAAVERELPSPRLQPLVARMAVPGLVLLVVLLLPAPPAVALSDNPLIEDALEQFEEQLEIAREDELIEEKSAKELEARLREIRQQEDAADWSDVDALANKLEHLKNVERHKSERMRAALAELAQRARNGQDVSSEMQKLLDAAGGEQALAELPEELAKKIRDGNLGACSEGDLAQLAEALEQAGAGLEAFEGKLLDPAQLEDLKRLVAAQQAEQGKDGDPKG